MESTGQLYPDRPNPSDTHALAAGHSGLWTRGSVYEWLTWRASWDFRLDTHEDVDRSRWFDVEQRGFREPAGSLRELYVDAKLDHVDLRLGKQEIRWGRADRFNPTDNLTPHDYLNPFSEERIPVPAVKADAYIKSACLEAAWVPLFTPTRLPLLNQRWFPRLPTSTQVPGPSGEMIGADLSFQDGRVSFPARTFEHGQWGVRWNQIVPRAEFSVSYFDGYHDIPFFRSTSAIVPVAAQRPQVRVTLDREYHREHVAGADFATALGPVGIRGELAYSAFDRTDPTNRDRLVFVVGLDRTWREWFAIVQYTDQVPGPPRGVSLFPDQGLRSTILYRVERTMGPSRSFELRGGVGVRDGGVLLQPLYNLALSDAWRLRAGVTVLLGSRGSYFGQYRDNTYLDIQLRYTF